MMMTITALRKLVERWRQQGQHERAVVVVDNTGRQHIISENNLCRLVRPHMEDRYLSGK
jgi:hypothetical protein